MDTKLLDELADELALDGPPLFDPAAPLVASGNLRRRQAVNVAAIGGATISAVLAVFVLGLVIETVVHRGGGVISWAFLTQAPPLFGGAGGGIEPMIVGSALIVGVATVMAAPIGVLVALYVSEFAHPRLAGPIRLALDLLNGLPSIVLGLFAFGLVVVPLHHQSGFAASIALAIIMLPLIARATQEMLRLVPTAVRDAADALGVARWRAVIGIVLPSVMGGIVTGVVLAIARAAGETAPLIITSSIFKNETSLSLFGQAIPNMPVSIFTLSEQPDPNGIKKAWGTALVLLAFILLTNIGARAMLARSQRRLGR